MVVIRRSIVIAAVVLCCALFARRAQAETQPDFILGVALAGLGGAGALVADFGCLVYISDLEYARAWGWLSVLSGITATAGGIVLSDSDPGAPAGGSVLIAFGVTSVALGIVGIALPRRESPHHPYFSARVLRLTPLLAPDGTAAIGLSGEF